MIGEVINPLKGISGYGWHFEQQVYNAEGYSDPTAYLGTKEVIREESEADKRAYDLVKVLKYIVRAAGFELTEHIQLRDTKSGREYK